MDATALTLAAASGLGLLGLAAAGVLAMRRLQQREQVRALERQQQLHRERLDAIGAMAAGVLREIGNPIAAIDGYARAMVDAQRRGELPPPPAPCVDPARIVEETARLAAIAHDISGLASAPATQRQLMSLNDVVEQALSLLRYDARLERVSLTTRLDAQVPAVDGVADRLVLLVTDLVKDGLERGATHMDIATRPVQGGVELEVSADAPGALPDRPLARAIAQEHGGLTEVKWNPYTGSRYRVRLGVRS